MRARLRPTLRRIGDEQSGMSLAEVLVSMVIFGVLLFAILNLLDTTSAVAPKDQERNDAVREAQVGLHKMVRELRQTYALNSSPQTASRMSVQVTGTGGVDRHVLIDCAQPSATAGLFACKRVTALASAAVPTSAAAGEVVVDRLISSSVFIYSPDATGPKYVQAKIRVPASGERDSGFDHELTLDDGFFMRNLSLLN